MRGWLLLLLMLAPLSGCLDDGATTNSVDEGTYNALAESLGATVMTPELQLEATEDDIFLLAAEASPEGAITTFEWYVPDDALRGDDYLDIGMVPLFDEAAVDQWVAYLVAEGEVQTVLLGGQFTAEGTLLYDGMSADDIFDATKSAAYDIDDDEMVHLVVGVVSDTISDATMALAVLEDDFDGPDSVAEIEAAIEDEAGWLLEPVRRASGVSNSLYFETFYAPFGMIALSHGDIEFTDASQVSEEGVRAAQDIVVRATGAGERGLSFISGYYNGRTDAGTWAGELAARGTEWADDGVIANAAVTGGFGGFATGFPAFFAIAEGEGTSHAELAVETGGGGGQDRDVIFVQLSLGATMEELVGISIDQELSTAPGVVNFVDGKLSIADGLLQADVFAGLA